jgi:hypothetical protein
MQQSSLQVAAVKLMRAGFSSYMGEKITQQLEIDRIAREQNIRLLMTR